MASAFPGAQEPADLTSAIALGSATQIALFVAPVLVLASYALGPSPMNLQFWPGAVAMILLARSPPRWSPTAAAVRGSWACCFWAST